MCQYFSCVATPNTIREPQQSLLKWVETKGIRAYYLETTSSHESIISELQKANPTLKDTDAYNRLFVRFEVTWKDKRKVTRSPEDWNLRADEDNVTRLPEFYTLNQAKVEEAVWDAWAKSVQVQLAISGEEKRFENIQAFAFDAAKVVTCGSSNAKVVTCGSSNAKVVTCDSSNAQVETYDSSNAQVETYGSSNAKVETYGSSNAKVETYGSSNAKVETYDSSNAQVETCDSSNAQVETCDSSNAQVVTCGSSNAKVVTCGSSNAKVVTCGSSNAKVVTYGSSNAKVVTYDSSNAQVENKSETAVLRVNGEFYLLKAAKIHKVKEGTVKTFGKKKTGA